MPPLSRHGTIPTRVKAPWLGLSTSVGNVVMKASYLIAGICPAFFFAPSAYAIAPAQFSLAEVFRAADAVVIADCGPTRAVVPKNDDGFDHRTMMTVAKRLYGPATFPRDFQLSTDHRASCNYDLEFVVGSKALLFLKWSADDDAYRAVGRSEGCFELNESLEIALTARVPELGKILALDDSAARDTALTAFYVELCINPTTRAIGTHSLYLDTRNWMPLKTSPVSADQNRRMVKAVLSELPPLNSTPALVRILAEYPDSTLDAYLIDSIRKWDRPGWSTLTRTAIEILPKRLNVELPTDLMADLNEHFIETSWDGGPPQTRKEEYFLRMRPALMERVLDSLQPKE